MSNSGSTANGDENVAIRAKTDFWTLTCRSPGLRVGWSGKQSYARLTGAYDQAIDGGVRISTCKDWPWDDRYKNAQFLVNGDGFPAFEMFYTGDYSKVIFLGVWYHTTLQGVCLFPGLCDWNQTIETPIL